MRRLLFLCLSGLALFSVWFFITRTPFPSEPARLAISEDYELWTGSWVKQYNNGYRLVSGPEKMIDESGPRVILIASAGREASDFNELVNELMKSAYYTVAIEHNGINESNFPDDLNLASLSATITSNLTSTPAKPTVLIGHAYGNRAVRYAAHQDPDNVKAVILLAAGGQVPMEPKAEQALRDIFNPLKPHKARMKDVEHAFFAEGNDIPDHWTRGWHTKTAIAQGKAVAASAGDDSWHCAGGVPMLIVQPMQDRIAPIENAYALRDKCPQEVEIVEIENAGHALLPEQPEAVAEAVLAFLAKHHPVE